MADQVDLDRDFSFDTDLSGISAPTGKNTFLPEGYYKGTIDDMYINREKNPDRVVVKVKVAEGPFTGTIRTTGLGIPKDANDKVRFFWRGLAESCGFTAAQLDKGAIKLGPTAFKGKSTHFYFLPKDENVKGREYEQVSFLAPVEWNQQKQNFEMAVAAGQYKTASDSGDNGKAAPPTSSGSTMTKSELMAKLGLG